MFTKQLFCFKKSKFYITFAFFFLNYLFKKGCILNVLTHSIIDVFDRVLDMPLLPFFYICYECVLHVWQVSEYLPAIFLYANKKFTFLKKSAQGSQYFALLTWHVHSLFCWLRKFFATFLNVKFFLKKKTFQVRKS